MQLFQIVPPEDGIAMYVPSGYWLDLKIQFVAHVMKSDTSNVDKIELFAYFYVIRFELGETQRLSVCLDLPPLVKLFHGTIQVPDPAKLS